MAVDLYLRARHQYNRMNRRARGCASRFEEALTRMPNDATLLNITPRMLARLWFTPGTTADWALAATEQAIKAAQAARAGTWRWPTSAQ